MRNAALVLDTGMFLHINLTFNLEVSLDSLLPLYVKMTIISIRAFVEFHFMYSFTDLWFRRTEQEALFLVSHTLFTCQLDYCNVWYMVLLLKNSCKLQLIQDEAAWVVTYTTCFALTISLLQHLWWLPISSHMQFKLIAITFKTLNYSSIGFLWKHPLPIVFTCPVRSGRWPCLH